MTERSETRAALADGCGRAKAVEGLARYMYERLEQLDPTDDRDWPELSERERELYRLVVRGILDRRRLLMAALGGPAPDDDQEDRST